ncbi:MAG: DUF2236 domain-containing protein [Caldithrix sp.]|nr:DUF2236 domain-containing protein [Caldithrix sp.]
MKKTRWSDEFLDHLKQQGDRLADEYLQKMIRSGEVKHAGELFGYLNTNDVKPVHERYPAFTDYYNQTNKLPANVDLKRIENGENFFIDNAFPASLILLTKSLPEGYAALNFTTILSLSKNLELHPYHRLLKVMQMLLNVGASRGFQPHGRAIISAQKLRLLHAGIRIITGKHLPDFRKKFGEPVNLEDMLATLMGFSLLVIDGLQMLGCSFSREEAEDYFYVWRVYALLMGIHPHNDPDSFDYIPHNLNDARLFYDKYAKRHYTDAEHNPHGVHLERANLQMMKQFIPSWLKRIGFGKAPIVYTQHLIGKDACRKVGVKPVRGHRFYKTFLFSLPRVWLKLYGLFYNHHHQTGHHFLAQIFFGKLINNEFGHIVNFEIPLSIKDMHKMG